MITVEHLTRRYAATTAVDDISFEVKPNEVIGFLGPNGAGKSTTLKVLTCFHTATSGRVEVGGYDVFKNPGEVKKLIGYLPENVPLYPEMRVSEYLKYRAGLKSIQRSKRAGAVDGVIERCMLREVKNRIIGQLSKGYRQRVGLADALVGDPKILVLDEPTIGLDPNQIRQVRDLIRELGRERTVILSSHILPEVEAVCTRVLIINKGKIVGQGSPDELRESLRGGNTTVSLEIRGSGDTARDAIMRIDGIRDVSEPEKLDTGLTALKVTADSNLDVREQIFDTAVDTGFKILSQSAKTVSLEEIFVEITTGEEVAE